MAKYLSIIMMTLTALCCLNAINACPDAILTTEQLDDVLSTAGNKLVVVNFWSPKCARCESINDAFTQFNERYSRVAKLLNVDVDAAPEVAERYTYTALPHILFIRNGQTEAQLSNPTAQIIEAHILALFQLDA